MAGADEAGRLRRGDDDDACTGYTRSQSKGGIEHLGVQSDRRVARGGATARTDSGDIDAGIDTKKLIPYGNGTDLDLGEMACRVLNARHNTDESHRATTFLMFATDDAHRDRPDPFGVSTIPRRS